MKSRVNDERRKQQLLNEPLPAPLRGPCGHCGKPWDDPLHMKHGPDLDNPRKHKFVPNMALCVKTDSKGN